MLSGITSSYKCPLHEVRPALRKQHIRSKIVLPSPSPPPPFLSPIHLQWNCRLCSLLSVIVRVIVDEKKEICKRFYTGGSSSSQYSSLILNIRFLLWHNLFQMKAIILWVQQGKARDYHQNLQWLLISCINANFI